MEVALVLQVTGDWPVDALPGSVPGSVPGQFAGDLGRNRP